jgi:cardiolipin synthase
LTTPGLSNLPNLITVVRLLAVPLEVWLMLQGSYAAAFWLFIALGVSDAVDGFLAKRFGWESMIGGYLDPIADKALLVGVYVTLGVQELLPPWLVILVVFRDILIVGGALLFETLTHKLEMAPLLVSKINTAAQIVLAAGVLGSLGNNLDVGAFTRVMNWVVAATTVSSGLAYLIKWGHMAITYEQEDR